MKRDLITRIGLARLDDGMSFKDAQLAQKKLWRMTVAELLEIARNEQYERTQNAKDRQAFPGINQS